jgi:hypothetical protein
MMSPESVTIDGGEVAQTMVGENGGWEAHRLDNLLVRPSPTQDQRMNIQTQAFEPQAGLLALSFPIADAARSTGPDLNSRIQRLGIERIAVLTREPNRRRGMRMRRRMRLRVHLREARLGPWRLGLAHSHPGVGDMNSGVSDVFCLRLLAFAAAIGLGLDRNWRECGGRTERLRGKHGLRKIESEKLIGAVFIRHRHTAPGQQQGADAREQDIFQGHPEPPE